MSQSLVLSRHRLLGKLGVVHNEDCLVTMAAMPDNFVDLVLTSPPYDEMRTYSGNDFNQFEAIAHELYRIIKIGGVSRMGYR